jgi:hypothetical protein
MPNANSPVTSPNHRTSQVRSPKHSSKNDQTSSTDTLTLTSADAQYYYKLVARSSRSTFNSIFDDSIQYRIDRTLTQSLGELNHASQRQDMQSLNGGFYVYALAEHAIDAKIPDNAALYCAPRVLLKCLCWGRRLQLGSSAKPVYCFENIKPVAAFELPLAYLASAPSKHMRQSIELEAIRSRMPKFASGNAITKTSSSSTTASQDLLRQTSHNATQQTLHQIKLLEQEMAESRRRIIERS